MNTGDYMTIKDGAMDGGYCDIQSTVEPEYLEPVQQSTGEHIYHEPEPQVTTQKHATNETGIYLTMPGYGLEGGIHDKQVPDPQVTPQQPPPVKETPQTESREINDASHKSASKIFIAIIIITEFILCSAIAGGVGWYFESQRNTDENDWIPALTGEESLAIISQDLFVKRNYDIIQIRK